MSKIPSAITLATVLAGAVAAQGEHATSKPQAARKPVFDERADAKADIAAALTKSKRDHKRVLLAFGANSDAASLALCDALRRQKGVAELVRAGYELVLVDLGKLDKQMSIASGYGAEITAIPHVTVLDADGKPLAHSPASALLGEGRVEVAELVELLAKSGPVWPDAEQVLGDALLRAKSEDKLLFVHFSGPN